MRATEKQLKELGEQIATTLGKPYKVVPFPSHLGGYNFVIEGEGFGYQTLKSGLSPREMYHFLTGMIEGMAAMAVSIIKPGQDTAQTAVTQI